MSALGSYSAQGFQVTASNAVDLIAGTQAAGAGMVSANLQEMAREVHVDFAQLGRTVTAQGRQLASVNADGFAAVRSTLEGGFGSLETLSGISIATQAVGFAVVAAQLAGVRRDVRELTGKAAELVDLQQRANAHLETLGEFAQRQLHTQEQILATLVSSRTVEAQQLIRQGWENLHNGYEDDAFERFARSLDYDNTVYFTHAELAALSEKRGLLDRAEDHFRRASRFAGSAGPPVVAFASVQLAAFLDRSGRVAEAVEVLRNGLATWRTPAWLFYQAELAAEAGDAETALRSLREAIAGDSALFAAAMMSTRLHKLPFGPARVLLDIDQEARGAVFDALQRTVVGVRQLTALSGDAGWHRATAASLFERAVGSEFRDLAGLRQEAEQLAGTCESTMDQSARAMPASVQAALDEFAGHLRQAPSSTRPGAPTTSSQRVLIFLVLIAPGVLCALIALVMVVAASGEAERWNGLICLGATAAVFLLPAAVTWVRTGASEGEERERRLHEASEAWLSWDNRTRLLAAGFARRRDDMQQRLSAALSHGEASVLREGLAWVARQGRPDNWAMPTWVVRRPGDGPGSTAQDRFHLAAGRLEGRDS